MRWKYFCIFKSILQKVFWEWKKFFSVGEPSINVDVMIENKKTTDNRHLARLWVCGNFRF
jgi:hypothetical protein